MWYYASWRHDNFMCIKKEIRCFDVSKSGMIALAFEKTTNERNV